MTAPSPVTEVDVVCLPPAGGSAASFRAWRAYRIPGAVLHPQLPPRSPDRPGPGLAGAAARLAERLRTVGDPSRPLILVGHSVGGLLACELARELQRHGERPASAVVVMGSRPLHLSSATYFRPLVDLPDRDLLRALDQLGVIHPQLPQSPMWPMVLPGLRSDLRLICAYAPPDDDPLPVPLHAWHGTADPLAPPELGPSWARHTTAGLQLRSFSGDHFFPGTCAQQVMAALADVVAVATSRAQGGPAPAVAGSGDRVATASSRGPTDQRPTMAASGSRSVGALSRAT